MSGFPTPSQNTNRSLLNISYGINFLFIQMSKSGI